MEETEKVDDEDIHTGLEEDGVGDAEEEQLVRKGERRIKE